MILVAIEMRMFRLLITLPNSIVHPRFRFSEALMDAYFALVEKLVGPCSLVRSHELTIL